MRMDEKGVGFCSRPLKVVDDRYELEERKVGSLGWINRALCNLLLLLFEYQGVGRVRSLLYEDDGREGGGGGGRRSGRKKGRRRRGRVI